MNPPYAELFCQSNFSFLQAASHPEELVERAFELGYQALAITDECSLAGVVRAHVAAKAVGLPLIVGTYVRLSEGDQLVLWAQHLQAYGEISQLITRGRMRSAKGSYQLHRDDVTSIIQQAFIGWIAPADTEQWSSSLDWLSRYRQDNIWLIANRTLNGEDKTRYQNLCDFAEQQPWPVVACGAVLMHVPERQPLLDTLTSIRLNQPVDQVLAQASSNTERHLRPQSSLQRLFLRQHLSHASELAVRCQFSLDELKYQYPAELVPAGHTPMSYLRQLVEQGQQWRFPDGVPLAIQAIIAKELALIDTLQYAHFFLTIEDIVRFAKNQRILYQGRGSAANSVVCYCLGITEVDPRKIQVLFERFISKERGEPPDIDVDFEHERREEVIQYIYQKYGRERAALAATVISYRFKSAVRDVGKALGFVDNQLDQFLAHVDRRDKQQDWHQQLTWLGPSDHPQVRHFSDLVEQIIGFPRHLSQHVGGFVISSGPLHSLVPTENAAMAARTVIQWDKDDLEALGLLKVDVLALGMLTAIRRCFDLVAKAGGPSLDMGQVQWEQPEVYDMLCQADSIGVFQIESRAQTNMLPRLRPRCYYDLVVQIAIVRPGPIQGDMVHPYLRRRHGKEPISYPNEAVKAVLERTMGVPIFQEQVIKLAMVAASFSAGEADQLRRAMASWKRNGKLAQFEHKLRSGMAKNGYSSSFADRIFKQILGFGEYGFPESHSASFALLAYVSAWLKYHHPAAFCCALLNSQPMGFYSPSQLIQDVQRHHVTVLPVDINRSDWHHKLVSTSQRKLAIQLGMRLIKGFSAATAARLCQHRPAAGYDCAAALQRLGINRHELQALAASGALNQIAGNRYQAHWQLSEATDNSPLFNQIEQRIKEPAPAAYLAEPSAIDNLLQDYQHLGLSLTSHPMQLLRERGEFGNVVNAVQLATYRHGEMARVAGVVVGRQRPGTASGVTFVTLEDETGNINVVVWRDTARAQRQPFLQAKILEVHGIVERDEAVIHLIAGRLIDQTHRLQALAAHSRDFH
ncbi:error-prone DNA polymerase [Neiella marina]|uniref:Error-prone DNA polymerase n=1 Tax=Neiella holothuriorum TaxID=2870530 RepID=A0ABS7EIN3_9GAMM|nr:error-prone DNA polymerase [Neiella holothuriorum]MBW8192216.1 error-prone DNA polymerase [Neiella holothuriorum]